MTIEEAASKVKELLGLSWRSVVICFGSICSWIILGGILTNRRAFVFLNDSLQWLGITDFNATVIEQYLQQHMPLFMPLSFILFAMVAFFSWGEETPSGLLRGTYGAVSLIAFLLLIALNAHPLICPIIFGFLMIEMWVSTVVHMNDSDWKVLGSVVFIGLLVVTSLYPLVLLARFLFPVSVTDRNG